MSFSTRSFTCSDDLLEPLVCGDEDEDEDEDEDVVGDVVKVDEDIDVEVVGNVNVDVDVDTVDGVKREPASPSEARDPSSRPLKERSR